MMNVDQLSGALLALTASALMLFAALNEPARGRATRAVLRVGLNSVGRRALPAGAGNETEVGVRLVVTSLGVVFGMALGIFGAGLLYMVFSR